jgi:hypothetical protein
MRIPISPNTSPFGSTLDLGTASSLWTTSNTATVSNGLGWHVAQASSGSFDVSADFEFQDDYTTGQGAPTEFRRFNFELTVTYVGYIDKNCVFQSAINSQLYNNDYYTPDQLYSSTAGQSQDTATITSSSLSSSQGQPGDANYIVVAVDAHVRSTHPLLNPSPSLADFTASGTYWILP